MLFEEAKKLRYLGVDVVGRDAVGDLIHPPLVRHEVADDCRADKGARKEPETGHCNSHGNCNCVADVERNRQRPRCNERDR